LKKQGGFGWCWQMAGVVLISSLSGCVSQQRRPIPAPTVRPVSIRGVSQPIVQINKVTPFVRHDKVVPASWIPPQNLEDRNRWHGIVIHHSVSEWGSIVDIDKWHKEKGYDGVGYHFVINNGQGKSDGKVEVGWRWRRQHVGAHCRPKGNRDNYWNKHTVGICLIGNFEKSPPTSAQYESLAKLINFLQDRYDIPAERIKGHSQIPGAKTACPGRKFSWWRLRKRINELTLKN